MNKNKTTTIPDEFIDECLLSTGVKFTDCTRPSDNGSKAMDAQYEQIRKPEGSYKAEEEYEFQKRKSRVLMIGGLILATAAMIAFIEIDQISYALAMCFNAALAAAFGYHVK